MIALGYGFWSEWELYEKVDFDGPNKLIVVYPHVTNLDIREDVYSAWIRWFSMEDRNYDRYDLAMERKGLDDIPGGQTGDSYFTRNYWKLVVDFSKVAVTGVLYSRNYGSAYFALDLTIQFAAQVSALVNTVTTVENVVTGDIGTIEPKISDIHGQVRRQIWFDSSAAVNGNGYQQSPYKIQTDAVDYAESNGISIINTFSDMALTKPLRNLTVKGIGLPLFDIDGFDIKGTELWHIRFTGVSTQPFIAQQCQIEAGAGLYGNIELCTFAGDIQLSGPTHIINGISGKEGAGYISIIVGSHVLQVTNWHRSLGITGITGGTHTIEMYGGQFHLDDTCTGGTIYLRGEYSLPPDDQSTGTLLIDQTESAINRQLWQDQGFDADNPVAITDTSREVAGVTRSTTDDGTTTMVERQ